MHMYALWMKNTSESDPRSYEATKAVANKAPEKILRLHMYVQCINQVCCQARLAKIILGISYCTSVS